MEKRKAAIIGVGHVGAHVAYTLCDQGTVDEIMLIDVNGDKLTSEVQDLRDCVAYMPHRVEICQGDFGDLAGYDVIVNSIGKVVLCATLNRLDEMAFTVHEVTTYTDKINASGFDGVIVNITNPCDIITSMLLLDLGGILRVYLTA